MTHKPIEPGQKTALVTLLKACIGEDIPRDERLWITSRLLQKEITSFNVLLEVEWKKIRDSAYPNYGDFETISTTFRAGVRALHRHYQEKVL